jgi:hypothetical protein
MSICQIKIPISFFSLHVAQAFPTSCHMGRASLLRNFCEISWSCLRNSQVAWWVMVLVYGLYRLYMYDTQLVEDSWFRTLVKYFDYKTFVLLFKTSFPLSAPHQLVPQFLLTRPSPRSVGPQKISAFLFSFAFWDRKYLWLSRCPAVWKMIIDNREPANDCAIL